MSKPESLILSLGKKDGIWMCEAGAACNVDGVPLSVKFLCPQEEQPATTLSTIFGSTTAVLQVFLLLVGAVLIRYDHNKAMVLRMVAETVVTFATLGVAWIPYRETVNYGKPICGGDVQCPVVAGYAGARNIPDMAYVALCIGKLWDLVVFLIFAPTDVRISAGKDTSGSDKQFRVLMKGYRLLRGSVDILTTQFFTIGGGLCVVFPGFTEHTGVSAPQHVADAVIAQLILELIGVGLYVCFLLLLLPKAICNCDGKVAELLATGAMLVTGLRTISTLGMAGFVIAMVAGGHLPSAFSSFLLTGLAPTAAAVIDAIISLVFSCIR